MSKAQEVRIRPTIIDPNLIDETTIRKQPDSDSDSEDSTEPKSGFMAAVYDGRYIIIGILVVIIILLVFAYIYYYKAAPSKTTPEQPPGITAAPPAQVVQPQQPVQQQVQQQPPPNVQRTQASPPRREQNREQHRNEQHAVNLPANPFNQSRGQEITHEYIMNSTPTTELNRLIALSNKNLLTKEDDDEEDDPNDGHEDKDDDDADDVDDPEDVDDSVDDDEDGEPEQTKWCKAELKGKPGKTCGKRVSVVGSKYCGVHMRTEKKK